MGPQSPGPFGYAGSTPASGTMPGELDRPVFVVGCGRSGTTLLGTLLGAHPDVVYLNEPRQLWAQDPRTNVWWPGAGRIVLTGDDLALETAAALRRRFAARVAAGGGRRLVEKTPINAFRIGYVHALCPDARFVHLLRDGRAVAASIARLASAPPGPSGRRGWPRRRARRSSPGGFGAQDMKWQMLRDLAASEAIDATVADGDMARRGLVEWRLAVTFARRSLAGIDPSRWTEVRYEDLVGAPAVTVAALQRAVELDESPEVAALARREVRPPGAPPPTLGPVERALAGDLLVELGYGD